MWRSVAVIAVALIVCAFSLRQWSVARDEAHREAQLRRETEAEVSRLRQQVASLHRAPQDSPVRDAPAPGDKNGGEQRRRPQTAESTAIVAALPVVTDVEVTRANLKVGMQKSYAALIRELKLTDQEARDLVELLAAEEFARTHPPDVEPSGPPKIPLEEKVESILGYRRMQAFRDYQGTMLDQVRANQIATSMYAAGIALSDEQKTGLARAMIVERQALPPPTSAVAGQEGVETFASWQEDFNERVLDRMSATLTNKQLTFIRERFQTDVRTYRDLASKGNPLAVDTRD